MDTWDNKVQSVDIIKYNSRCTYIEVGIIIFQIQAPGAGLPVTNNGVALKINQLITILAIKHASSHPLVFIFFL